MNTRNISNTRLRGDGDDTPFGAWMRHHPKLDSQIYGLDIENIDYTLFLFIRGYLRILEEKRGYKNFSRPPQRDSHSVFDQICQFACTHPDFRAKRLYKGRTEKITYGGYHLIQLEKTSPEDGGIRLNGMTITKEKLLRFLRGEWEPTVHYEHLCKHQELLLGIMKCEVEEDLTVIKGHIMTNILPTIDPNSPERDLLRAVFMDKTKELAKSVFVDKTKELTKELHGRIDQAIIDIDGMSK